MGAESKEKLHKSKTIYCTVQYEGTKLNEKGRDREGKGLMRERDRGMENGGRVIVGSRVGVADGPDNCHIM